MTAAQERSLWLITPYAAGRVLMMLLPATAGGYAVRTAVTATLLVVARRRLPRAGGSVAPASIALGAAVGIVVCAIWVLPEQFGWEWYRRLFILGEGGTRAVAESSATMIAARLVGSAFVIAIAEELFFREWLIGFAGFWWMVALFAIEHDRWLVGAIAGIIYGILYLRRGLAAAIVAHVITNLALGLWVLATGQWQFW